MELTLRNQKTFVSTGGRDFNPKGNVLLFLHGSGQSHLSWMLQSRFFANRGWDVLAPDFPAHYLSAGSPLETIEDMADWSAELLEAAGVATATIIGHSQGGLICLELARRHPSKVKKMAIIASAMAIPVNDMLIDMASKKESKAARSMVSWSHGQVGHLFDHTIPGQNHLSYGQQLMGQNGDGVLLTDLKACNAYDDGEAAAEAIACPALCILAEGDKMVPAKFGKMLGEKLSKGDVTVVAKAGHFVHSEQSVQTNAALKSFFEAAV